MNRIFRDYWVPSFKADLAQFIERRIDESFHSLMKRPKKQLLAIYHRLRKKEEENV